jgi:hypothetical protein
MQNRNEVGKYRFLTSAICIVIGVFGIREACAASAALMTDGSSVVIGSDEGELRMWKRGETEPTWTIKTHGSSFSTQSPIAGITVLPDDVTLVVERAGNIITISPEGTVLQVWLPFYGFVRLKPDLSDVDWQKWEKQIDYIASTRAAFITSDASYGYLVSNEYSSVDKVLLRDLVHQQDRVITLTDGMTFQFKDHNLTIWKKSDPPSLRLQGEWPTQDTFKPSAIAACDGWIIVGSEEGYVEFISEGSQKEADRRIRQVANQSSKTRAILDAGCVGNGLAFTVSFDAGHGQIQLWDTGTQVATNWVELASNGHPGTAYVAVASGDGTRLLSLGAGDARLWAIQDKILSLVA